MTTSEREIGKLEAGLEALNRTVREGFTDAKEDRREIKREVAAIDERLARIEAKENERRGAWAVLVAVASICSGLVAWAVNTLFK